MGNYQSWIDQHYPDKASSLNKCNEAVRFMVMRFPEQIIVALEKKQSINENRNWPDPKTIPPSQPV